MPPSSANVRKELPQRRAREGALTRRRQAMGLLLLAAVILGLILYRAPAHWLFSAGWWRF